MRQIREKASRVESETFLNEKAKKQLKILESVAQTTAGRGLQEAYQKNPKKALNVATYVDKADKMLSKLSETSISTELGTTPENFKMLVRYGSALSVRGDIFTEIPMDTLFDAIYYLDTVIEKNERGAVAGDKTYESAAYLYGSETVLPQEISADGTLTAYTVTMTSTGPIVPFTAKILVGGALVGNDDGQGNLRSSLLDSTAPNTIDYTTKEVVLNFLVAPNAKVEVQYNFNSEVETTYDNWGTVKPVVRRTQFRARPKPLGFDYSLMTALTLEANLGVNAEQEMTQRVAEYMARAKDFHALALAKSVAKQNPVTTFNTIFSDVGEISASSHAKSLINKIGEVGGDIRDDIMRGRANVIVGGTKAVNYARRMAGSGWVEETNPGEFGVIKAGTLNGIPVYEAPTGNEAGLLANNEMLLTYKSSNEMDIGLAFGVYGSPIQTRLTFPEGNTVGNQFEVSDSQVINGKFVRLMTLEGLN